MATVDDEQTAIARRQRIAEMLMAQGAEPLETNQMAGGYVVPISPLAGIAKVAQALSGAYIGKKADERTAALGDRKAAMVKQMIANGGFTSESLADSDLGIETTLPMIAANETAKTAAGIKLADSHYQEGVDQRKAVADKEWRTQEGELNRQGRADNARLIAGLRPPPQPEKWQTMPDASGALQQVNPVTGEVRDIGMQGKAPGQGNLTGRPLPAASANILAEGSQLSTGVLGGLNSLVEDNEKMFGPISGAIHSINPYDEKGQEIDAELRRARQSIGSYLEGGVLRKEDEKKYEKMLPKLNDLPAVAKDKLEGIKALLINKQNEYLQSYGNAGFDVSKYPIPEIPATAKGGKTRIAAQAKPQINIDISPNTSAEDRAALAADIAKEQAKQAPKDEGADDPAYQEYLRSHKK